MLILPKEPVEIVRFKYMAKLFFRYAAMNASKSTALMQVAFNYHERGMRAVVVKPTIDTKSHKVVSRIGLEYEVDWPVMENDSILDFYERDLEANGSTLKCVIVDEAQFLTAAQIDDLFEIAVIHNVPVIAYGLRADFKTHAFPGSLRLLEIAHSLEELKTICRCGAKAIFNGRKIDGEFVKEGSQVAIDGQAAEYESLCGKCYHSKVGRPTSA